MEKRARGLQNGTRAIRKSVTSHFLLRFLFPPHPPINVPFGCPCLAHCDFSLPLPFSFLTSSSFLSKFPLVAPVWHTVTAPFSPFRFSLPLPHFKVPFGCPCCVAYCDFSFLPLSFLTSSSPFKVPFGCPFVILCVTAPFFLFRFSLPPRPSFQVPFDCPCVIL